MDELFKRWQGKQDQLQDFLREHGAGEAEYRVDLTRNLFFWVDDEGESLVVADAKVILSYALSNRSVLMGWANRHLDDACCLEPLPEFEDDYEDCQPEEVWGLAMTAAEVAGCDFIYRAPSPQNWVMLGLWNVRTGGERFEEGSPTGYVRTLLTTLLAEAENEGLSILLDNYGETLLQQASHAYKDSAYRSALQQLGNSFRDLSGRRREPKIDRARLQELLDQWPEESQVR